MTKCQRLLYRGVMLLIAALMAVVAAAVIEGLVPGLATGPFWRFAVVGLCYYAVAAAFAMAPD